MVVVAVSLALWIGVVWWQDKRTANVHVPQLELENKLDGEEVVTSERATEVKTQE